MINYSVDSATSQLTIGANCMSLSLFQCVKIALKNTVLQIIKRTSASNLGHACILYLGDDQNWSMLPQVHALVTNSSPPFLITFSHPPPHSLSKNCFVVLYNMAYHGHGSDQTRLKPHVWDSMISGDW